MKYLQEIVITQFNVDNLIIQKVYDIDDCNTYTVVLETRPYNLNSSVKVVFELRNTLNYLGALKTVKEYLKGVKK